MSQFTLYTQLLCFSVQRLKALCVLMVKVHPIVCVGYVGTPFFIDSTNKNIYPNHISFSVVTNSRFLVTGVTLDSKKRV